MPSSLAIGLVLACIAAMPALAQRDRRPDPSSSTGLMLDQSLGTNTFGPDGRRPARESRWRSGQGGSMPGALSGTMSGTTAGTTAGTTPGTLSGTAGGLR
jgi:hypothetical protein